MILNIISKLHKALADGGIPIHGVALLDVNLKSVRIDFKSVATAQQKTDAATIVAAFDWEQKEEVQPSAVDILLVGLDQVKLAVPTYKVPDASTIELALKNKTLETLK